MCQLRGCGDRVSHHYGRNDRPSVHPNPSCATRSWSGVVNTTGNMMFARIKTCTKIGAAWTRGGALHRSRVLSCEGRSSDLRKQRICTVSTKPRAECAAALTSLSMSASDPNSVQPCASAHSSAAAINCRPTPVRLDSGTTYHPSRYATLSVRQSSAYGRIESSAKPSTAPDSSIARRTSRGIRSAPAKNCATSFACDPARSSGQSASRISNQACPSAGVAGRT